MGKGKIATDVMCVLRQQSRHLSAHGIMQALIDKRFNRRKCVGSAESVGKMLKFLIGHNGIIGKPMKNSTIRYTEYWYDEVMHLCHSTIDFGRLIHDWDNRETYKNGE